MDYYEIIHSEPFKNWFGDWETAYNKAGLNFKDPIWNGVSKAVDENGKPEVLFHGTTHEWTTYNRKLGNPENDMGIGFYATSDVNDANSNYLAYGSDLTNKTAFLAESLSNNKNIPLDEARELINKKFIGDTEKIMEVFLKIKRPLILAHKGLERTYFNFAPTFDNDEYEESKQLIRFKEAFEDALDEYDVSYNVKIRAWDEFMQNIGELDYNSAHDIINSVKRMESLYDYLYNEELGGNNVYEFISSIFQKLRFDGVIYLDASEYFPNMNIGKGTRHFVVFKANQIKLADGTNTTFSTRKNDIRFDEGGLIFKKKRETEKELSHTDVYLGETYIGYYMPNKSDNAEINENWNFSSKHPDYPNLRAKTKDELISMINDYKISFDDGGDTDKEVVTSERFNLPVPKDIDDIEDGVDEILQQYASRRMASVQVISYLNENSDLSKEFINKHLLLNIHELEKHLKNRQSKLRKPILEERKLESENFQQLKAELNVDNIEKLAMNQVEGMENKITEQKID